MRKVPYLVNLFFHAGCLFISAAIFVLGTVVCLIFLTLRLLISTHCPWLRFQLMRLTRSLAAFTYSVLIPMVIGQKFQIVGDEIEPNENAILLVNESSLLSLVHVLRLAIMSRHGGICVSTMKDLHRNKFTFLSILNFFGVLLKTTAGKHGQQRLNEYLKEEILRFSSKPFLLIHFLENANSSEEYQKEYMDFCRQKKLPLLKNSRFPHYKDFAISFEQLAPIVKAVYDITIYQKGRKSNGFLNFLSGIDSNDVQIYIHKIEVSDIPIDSEDLTRKLIYSVWELKEKRLNFAKNHNKFPKSNSQNQRLMLLRIFLRNAIDSLRL